MRIAKKSVLVSAAIVVPVALAACSKKKDKSDEAAAQPTAVAPAASTPGVAASSGNDVTVTGTLALQGLSLIASAQGVLAFNLVGGELTSDPTDIAVDENGGFTVPLTRADSALDELLAEMKVPRESRDWAKLLELAGKVTDVGGATVDRLKSMSEEELNEGITEMAERAKSQGQMTLLVAYEKSGDKVAEASSFRFIGLPTAGGRNLSGLPNGSLIGNTSLGQISGDGVDVTSELPAVSAFDLSSEAQESYADVGSALKAVKNLYMNDGWEAEPFYVWNYNTGTINDAVDKFADVEKQEYNGYGFYVSTPRDSGFKFEELCGGKLLTFTPPAALTIKNGPFATAESVSVYDNKSTTIQTQGGSRMCEGGGFYAREDVRGDGTSFMVNFGTGGSIATSPEGLWKLAYGGSEVARFDFNTVSPVKDDKPIVFVQSPRFNTSGGSFVSVDLELYRYDGKAYVKVTDMAPVKSLVSEINCSIGRTSDNGESRVDMTINEDGSISGKFDSSQTEDGKAINAPVAASDAKMLACYYTIGTSNYRVSLMNWN